MSARTPVKLIAVAGGSGAGKGWLSRRLGRILGDQVCHLQLDDFYHDQSHLPPGRRAGVNFDLPQAIDWKWIERVLADCRAGRPTRTPCYDFGTHRRLSEQRRLAPRPLVLVDGLWLLRTPELRRWFDLKIFLDVPSEVRLARRLVRDTTMRGSTAGAVARRFRTEVEPMHLRHVEPQKQWADVVLTHPFSDTALRELVDRLRDLLAGGGVLAPSMHETFRAGQLTPPAPHEDSH